MAMVGASESAVLALVLVLVLVLVVEVLQLDLAVNGKISFASFNILKYLQCNDSVASLRFGKSRNKDLMNLSRYKQCFNTGAETIRE